MYRVVRSVTLDANSNPLIVTYLEHCFGKDVRVISQTQQKRTHVID